MEDAQAGTGRTKDTPKIFSVPAKRSVRIDKDTGSPNNIGEAAGVGRG